MIASKQQVFTILKCTQNRRVTPALECKTMEEAQEKLELFSSEASLGLTYEIHAGSFDTYDPPQIILPYKLPFKLA